MTLEDRCVNCIAIMRSCSALFMVVLHVACSGVTCCRVACWVLHARVISSVFVCCRLFAIIAPVTRASEI